MVLTAEQHADFVEQGAVVFDTRLPPDLLDEVEATLDSPARPHRTGATISGPWSGWRCRRW